MLAISSCAKLLYEQVYAARLVAYRTGQTSRCILAGSRRIDVALNRPRTFASAPGNATGASAKGKRIMMAAAKGALFSTVLADAHLGIAKEAGREDLIIILLALQVWASTLINLQGA